MTPIYRIVEFQDGTYGIEQCHGAGIWNPTGFNFRTEQEARDWKAKNTVKRVVA